MKLWAEMFDNNEAGLEQAKLWASQNGYKVDEIVPDNLTNPTRALIIFKLIEK